MVGPEDKFLNTVTGEKQGTETGEKNRTLEMEAAREGGRGGTTSQHEVIYLNRTGN